MRDNLRSVHPAIWLGLIVLAYLFGSLLPTPWAKAQEEQQPNSCVFLPIVIGPPTSTPVPPTPTPNPGTGPNGELVLPALPTDYTRANNRDAVVTESHDWDLGNYVLRRWEARDGSNRYLGGGSIVLTQAQAPAFSNQLEAYRRGWKLAYKTADGSLAPDIGRTDFTQAFSSGYRFFGTYWGTTSYLIDDNGVIEVEFEVTVGQPRTFRYQLNQQQRELLDWYADGELLRLEFAVRQQDGSDKLLLLLEDPANNRLLGVLPQSVTAASTTSLQSVEGNDALTIFSESFRIGE